MSGNILLKETQMMSPITRFMYRVSHSLPPSPTSKMEAIKEIPGHKVISCFKHDIVNFFSLQIHVYRLNIRKMDQ